MLVRRSLFLAPVLLVACSSAQPTPAPPAPTAAETAAQTGTSAAPDETATAAVPATATPPAPAVAEVERIHDDEITASTTGRLAVGGGVEIVVVARASAPEVTEPLVTLALVEKDRVLSREDGFETVVGQPFAKTGIGGCETWTVTVQREPLGKAEAVRVSLVCATGEDYRTVTEVVALLRLDGSPRAVASLPRLWGGVANALRNDMDSCISRRTVTFALTDDKTLERRIDEDTHWVSQNLDADLKKRLKADCPLGKKKSVERVTLP